MVERFGVDSRPMCEWGAEPLSQYLPQSLRLGWGTEVRSHADGPRRRLALLARSGASSAADAFVYDRAFRQFRTDAYAAPLLDAVRGQHPDALYRSVWNDADGTDDVDRALFGDLNTYLPDQRLVKADRASMAQRLEARAPGLATALGAEAASVPAATARVGRRAGRGAGLRWQVPRR